jgi:hypothetical protein
MKTLLDITREHIARNAALVNNPEQMIAEAHQAELRMQARFQADPSLLTFVEHYARALVNVLVRSKGLIGVMRNVRFRRSSYVIRRTSEFPDMILRYCSGEMVSGVPPITTKSCGLYAVMPYFS